MDVRRRNSRRLPLRVVAALCALVLLGSAFPLSVFAETAEERYTRLKGELETLSGQISEAKEDRSAAAKLRDSLNAEKQVIDELIAINKQEIADAEKTLAGKEDDLAQKREALVETQDALAQRLVAMYTMNTSNTLSALFSVSSFTEFLQMVDAMKRISSKDGELIDTLHKQQTELEQEQQEINQLLEKLNTTYQELSGNADSLAANIRTQNGEISEQDAVLRANETAYGSTAAEAEQAYQEMMALSNSISGMGSAPGQGVPGTEQPAPEQPAPPPETPAPPAEPPAPEAPSDGTAPPPEGIPEAPAPEAPPPEAPPAPPPAPPVMGQITTWPVPTSRRITCYYGQPDPSGKPHLGMDIAAPYNTPIVAAGYGTVIVAGSHSSYGNYIIIDHGNGLKTLYAHCNSLLVGVGATVNAGETIALMGSTGYSTGSHLHIEVHNPGRQDPLGYLP